MRRLVLGPFNRVEGDLEVSLDLEGSQVAAAYVNSPLYRGFEQILADKSPLDALVFVPRICGICSVAQSAAAATALADAMGLAPPENGRLAANLVLAAENLADHLSHFYLFFMPDFTGPAYGDRAWHGEAVARFEAMAGTSSRRMLPARASLLQTMGILAGKWPHTLALQPGGSTRPVQVAERLRLVVLLREFRAWLEEQLFGDRLEAVAAIPNLPELLDWSRQPGPAAADFGLFLRLAEDLELWQHGRAADLFMSYGAYAQETGHFFAAGLWDGRLHPLDPDQIREDASHAWLAEEGGPRHPSDGLTRPQAGKAGAYSWCKAPRLGGRAVEVGALARQVVAGQPLARDLVARHGGNAFARVVMRLVEIARVLPAMEAWSMALEPGAPYCSVAEMPAAATGTGLVEAARGALGHWLMVREGRLANYQIIAPTTWNFSPRDGQGIPGPLEQALVGLPAGEGAVPLVQHRAVALLGEREAAFRREHVKRLPGLHQIGRAHV